MCGGHFQMLQGIYSLEILQRISISKTLLTYFTIPLMARKLGMKMLIMFAYLQN